MKPLPLQVFSLSPAKINLGLKILYKREDGYHEISSFILKINWGDEIYIEKAKKNFFLISKNLIQGNTRSSYDDISLSHNWKNNILYKTFLLLKENIQFDFGVKIFLNKKIPLGSGLGGSSSNAAFLLSYFSHFLETKKKKEIACKLGADVSLFLEKKHTYVAGIGEKNQVIELSQGKGLLALSNISLKTKEMYEILKNPLQKKLYLEKSNFLDKDILQNLKKGKWKDLQNVLINDFEIPAFSRFGYLGKIKESFLEFGACYSSMSGSGSSIFCLFEKDKECNLDLVCAKMKKRFPNLLLFNFSF